MQSNLYKPCMLAAGVLLASVGHAADVRINGFASIGGGTTLSEGTARRHLVVDPNGGTESNAVYVADPVTEGVYDDDWSFKPDSNLGIQISSNLGDGLSVTGQITANGGEDFDANVSWAYVNYSFSDQWAVMAGRQRLPLFYYSDFIDVAYTYHWIRPPQELVASDGDTFEGVKLRWTAATDNWDWAVDTYYGSGNEKVGERDVESNDQIGIVVKVSNDWLILRGTWLTSESIINTPEADAFNQGTKDNPLEYDFIGLAAHMTFDNIFVVTEFTRGEPNEPIFPILEVNGTDQNTGWYISSGIRLGAFTPHITYSEQTDDYKVTGQSFESKVEAITVGVRWDFHPSAALKAEYLTRSDESDDYFKNTAGGYGYGDPGEVDVVSFAVDVIF